MTLAAGTRLGPYGIAALIGAGGMGEVYRAQDTRLGRTVAVKVLPAHLSADPERRKRLEREGRAVSRLSHPHICALYDVGHQDGVLFLVLEYVEGETLAHRLEKGPLPPEQALRYGIEIADALDSAHRQGVVHRDLKPANVMLTKSGAKLLDFGLSKLHEVPDGSSSSQLSALPTADQPLTSEGTILGTFQYVAPEQLEGKEADAKTDIFALGSLLYEMATGARAFTGKSRASLISSIMTSDPPSITTLQPMSPPALDRVVRACLTKDPDERWQSAHDVAKELRWITEGADTSAPAMMQASRWPHLLLVAALLGAAALGGLTAWVLARRAPAAPLAAVRLAVALPAEAPLAVGSRPPLALSPDGKWLVYVARHGESTRLYLRNLASYEATPMPGTAGADGPFFSPDGQWVGFFESRNLKKALVAGGGTHVVADVATVTRGAAWELGGSILFTPTRLSGLARVTEGGGQREFLTNPDLARGERNHAWPQTLPGGAVLFTIQKAESPSFDDARIAVRSPGTGEVRVLLDGGHHARYLAPGHLVYARDGSLFAVAFDLNRLQVSGTPVRVVEGVGTDPVNGGADFAVTHGGTLAYVPGSSTTPADTLVWVDRRGAAQPVGAPPGRFSYPTLSPGGDRLGVTLLLPNTDVWIYDLARAALTRLTTDPGTDFMGAWTPDGRRVTFSSDRNQGFDLFWKPADGGSDEALLSQERVQFFGSWSPDGKVLAFVDGQPVSGTDISILRFDGDRRPEPLMRTPFSESQPRFSPDGRWLAYVSDESGRDEVYARPFPGPGPGKQISSEGGMEAVWSRDGREIFFRSGDRMMAVAVSGGRSLVAGRPRLLFRGDYAPSRGRPGFPNYDVARDGRFLMIREAPTPAATQVNVVLGWSEELKQLLPPLPR